MTRENRDAERAALDLAQVAELRSASAGLRLENRRLDRGTVACGG